MGSTAVPAVLSSAAFPRLGPHDHLLGLVQLLRAFADCLAIFRLWTTADLGAVSLSWNRGAHHLLADIVASSSRISDVRISSGNRLWRHWRRDSVVRRPKAISASGHANGVVHLRCCSQFHGAVLSGDYGIRRNLQPLDRGFRSRMVGSRNRLAACCSLRMAAYQWTDRVRTAFAKVDVVFRHYRRCGGNSYRPRW